MSCTDEARQELEKFFTIASSYENFAHLKMPVCPVDDYWHDLMLRPAAYSSFCLNLVGDLVEHVECGGIDQIEWVSAYEERYGPLPRIWFTSDQAHENYRKSGVMIASWTCSPALEKAKRTNEENTKTEQNSQTSTIH